MKHKISIIVFECLVVFVVTPLLLCYTSRHRNGTPCMFTEESLRTSFAVPILDEDSDEDARLKLAYVAQYGDREKERQMAQNAFNWLESNSTADLQGDGAEKFLAFTDKMYLGTKERMNDWTHEQRRKRYDDRAKQAQRLVSKLQFVIDENGDDERCAEDTRQAKNALSFLNVHTSKFDNWSRDNVVGFANRIDEMYNAAEKRRGVFRKATDPIFRWLDGFFAVEWQSLSKGSKQRVMRKRDAVASNGSDDRLVQTKQEKANETDSCNGYHMIIGSLPSCRRRYATDEDYEKLLSDDSWTPEETKIVNFNLPKRAERAARGGLSSMFYHVHIGGKAEGVFAVDFIGGGSKLKTEACRVLDKQDMEFSESSFAEVIKKNDKAFEVGATRIGGQNAFYETNTMSESYEDQGGFQSVQRVYYIPYPDGKHTVVVAFSIKVDDVDEPPYADFKAFLPIGEKFVESIVIK